MDIRSELEVAWRKTVAEDYLTGAIAWESDLQASIYRALRIRCPGASVFLEARMLGGEERRTDLVLCEASDVRLIAEIKFQPFGYPEWEPDIGKLSAIARLDRRIGHELTTNPVTGRFSVKKHYVNSDTRYAFIAVGRDDSEAVYLERIEPKLDLSLFSLCYGRIRPGAEPHFDVEHSDPELGVKEQ